MSETSPKTYLVGNSPQKKILKNNKKEKKVIKKL